MMFAVRTRPRTTQSQKLIADVNEGQHAERAASIVARAVELDVISTEWKPGAWATRSSSTSAFSTSFRTYS